MAVLSVLLITANNSSKKLISAAKPPARIHFLRCPHYEPYWKNSHSGSIFKFHFYCASSWYACRARYCFSNSVRSSVCLSVQCL